MRDHMANSKPYISFVLLFTFLLSCQAHKHSYNDEGNNLEHPTLSQDLGKDWRRGYSMPNRMSLHRYDFQWAQPTPPIAKSGHHHAHWIDYHREPPTTERDHHTYSVDHHGDLPTAKSDRQIGSIDYYRGPLETDHHTYSVDYHRDPSASKSYHHRNAFHGPAPHPDAKPGFYTHRHDFQWADPPPIPAAETKSDYHTYSTDYQRASLEDIAKIDHHIYLVDHHGGLSEAKSDSIDYYRDPPETDHHTYLVNYHRNPPASKSDHRRNVFHGPAPHPIAKPGFYTHSTTGYHRHGFRWAEPPPPETRSDHPTYSVDYQHASLEDIEPSKNYEDGTVMRHRKMMKPSETGDNVIP